jgi:hypothetical protein
LRSWSAKFILRFFGVQNLFCEVGVQNLFCEVGVQNLFCNWSAKFILQLNVGGLCCCPPHIREIEE